MGRDWTPFEHYLAEQAQIKRGLGNLFDFMENLKMVNLNDNAEKILNSPEKMEIRRQIPCLGKYLFDDFLNLYEHLSHFENGTDFLHQKDTELAAYIQAREYTLVEAPHGEIRVRAKAREGDKDSYLIKWFHGKLDEHFYYGERNNELLIENICSEAIQKGLSNWILTDPDCLQMRRQIGFEGRGIFELIQIEQIPVDDDRAKSVYLVADGEIDFDDYTQDEINSALNGFGYENMKSLICAAGSRNEAYGQLAEMLFELSSGFATMRFGTWHEAAEHIEYRTGKELSAYKEDNNMSLAARLVEFYKSYDLYDYRDSLEVGDTDEDAINYLEEHLADPRAVDGILEALNDFSSDPDLDADQQGEIICLLADVQKIKRAFEVSEDQKRSLTDQIQTAAAKSSVSNKEFEIKEHDKATER